MKHVAFAVAIACLIAPPAFADEKVDHYAAKPSDTLEEAITNFREHNAILAGILDKAELSRDDMEDIHQLTYTLEVALAKLISESTALAEQLENVHLSSEGDDVAVLRAHATDYLETARKIVP